jgi:hypothetical protein
MRLDDGDSVVSMEILSLGADILTVSENGFGKLIRRGHACASRDRLLGGVTGKSTRATLGKLGVVIVPVEAVI